MNCTVFVLHPQPLDTLTMLYKVLLNTKGGKGSISIIIIIVGTLIERKENSEDKYDLNLSVQIIPLFFTSIPVALAKIYILGSLKDA